MSLPTFASQRNAWSNPPVDDEGYFASSDLLTRSDDELHDLILRVERARYLGWRNFKNRWVDTFLMEKTFDSDVLDFGCGIGIEALQYAKFGNRVHLADIAPANVELAQRVLELFGYSPAATHVLKEKEPRAKIAPESLDVVHCVGVLHHIPYARSVVEEWAKWLKPKGQARLMVYSDVLWKRSTGERPSSGPPEEAPGFDTFVRAQDGVGAYADWYDCTKLQLLINGTPFVLQHCGYITHRLEFVGARLVRR